MNFNDVVRTQYLVHAADVVDTRLGVTRNEGVEICRARVRCRRQKGGDAGRAGRVSRTRSDVVCVWGFTMCGGRGGAFVFANASR